MPPFGSVLATVLALEWDPGIRGILTVAVAVAVLCGSVYLLLATNTGHRLGFLIALTGLMGWMVVMGVVWSIYGIGYLGPAPSWDVVEINTGDLGAAETEVAARLPPTEERPEVEQFLSADPELAAAFEEQPREPTLGDLLTIQPELQDELDFNGWELLSPSDPQRGEAEAAADEALGPDGQAKFEDASGYVIVDAFSLGGKDRRADDSLIGRVFHKVTSTLTLTHPPHYAIVQVQPVVDTGEPEPGEAPPPAEADPDRPVYSVVMLRELGALRLPSVGLTIFSAVIFAVLCNMLHHRDKRVTEARTSAGAG